MKTSSTASESTLQFNSRLLALKFFGGRACSLAGDDEL